MVAGRAPVITGTRLTAASARGGRAVLRVTGEDRKIAEFASDHVIAAAGYPFSLSSLPFLRPALAAQLRSTSYGPILSGNFESSVPACAERRAVIAGGGPDENIIEKAPTIKLPGEQLPFEGAIQPDAAPSYS
jgi:hypothetical protein